MQKGYLKPTPDQTFELIGGNNPAYNFATIYTKSFELQSQGDFEAACNLRFKAVQDLQEILPEEEEVTLEWNHRNSAAAIEIVNCSAVDHFLINDIEMASALLELSLDIDPEDHLEASNLLAFCYVALGEDELFDEIINDISEKQVTRTLLMLWSSFMRQGTLSEPDLKLFKSRYAPYYDEFIAEVHPSDDKYLSDIESEKPSSAALARELWLKTEILWEQSPEFIEALRNQV